ncbi:MAG: MOP flippase family protein [Candidatus Omnitrophica bacterium]|nr:MOP flippase family protein [Candidatus Omnitrophota bacterium]
MKTLKQKTVSGFKWLLVNKIVQRVISVVTFAILARILDPSTFGLFAMAFIAIDGLSLFKTFGLDGGIIQKKDSPEAASHTAAVLILSMSLVLSIICFAVAPLVGKFFDNAELGSIVKALGAVFVISGFGRIPSAILTRHLRFRLISIIDVISSAVNCFFAVAFAMVWPTVWSLVGAYFIKHSVTAVLSWYFSGYRFKWHFEFRHAKELFDFGKYLVATNIVSYVGGNVSNVVIGKMMGTTAVGFFTLAVNIGNFINSHFTHIISRVMFPAYSQIQDDRETVRKAYLKTVKFITMFSFPFSVLLITLAEEFVLTLYGEKWISIVPLIRLLGFAQMVAPILHTSSALYWGCGRSDYDFRMNVSYLLTELPLMIVLTKFYGLAGTVWAGLIMTWGFAPVCFFLVRRLIGVQWSDLFQQFSSALLCAVMMFLSIFLFKTALKIYPLFGSAELASFILLVLLSVIGLITYVVTFFFLDRKATLEVKSMVFEMERV